jgi:hypothetical protein
MSCTKWIPKLTITMGNYSMTNDFFVVDIPDTNVVLGRSMALLYWEIHD